MIRYLSICILLLLAGCYSPEIIIKSTERSYTIISKAETPTFKNYQDVYVSAYSNLYQMDGSRKIYYTVVLSLRNISFSDTLYFENVNYMNSEGNLLRTYLKDSVLVLHPLESLEYLVEQSEIEGGAGANFIVTYGLNAGLKNKPIIEAVMSGTSGQHGFAFKTEGVEIIK